MCIGDKVNGWLGVIVLLATASDGIGAFFDSSNPCATVELIFNLKACSSVCACVSV